MAQSYLAELLNHYSPACSLRSNDNALLAISQSRLKTSVTGLFVLGLHGDLAWKLEGSQFKTSTAGIRNMD